jgi:myo-inositol-1(or 4)-monophosphatase
MGAILPSLLSAIGDFRRLPVGLDLCYASSGRLDGALALGVELWDIAAAALIAQEAGAWLGDGSGGPATPKLTIVAAPRIANDLSRRIVSGLAESRVRES